MTIAPFVFERRLDNLPSPISWPPNLRRVDFDATAALLAHAILSQAYRNGFGNIGSFDEWYRDLTGDPEFEPALCFLYADSDRSVAFAQCWNSGFIKDIAVVPDRHRRGIGSLLLGTIFDVFASRGFKSVRLKVVPGNDAAIALYRKCGMVLLPEHDQ